MFTPDVAIALSFALLQSLWQLSVLGLAAAAGLWLLRHHSAALRHAVGMAALVAMTVAPVLTLARLAPSAATVPAAGATAAPWLAVLWLAGTGATALLHIGGGLLLLRRLDRAPHTALPPHWQRRVDAMRAQLGIARAVAVRIAAGVGTPFTARLLRPVIWLPQGLLEQLPLAQIQALLAHELAHIQRLDWLWNAVQCVIESLLFFHPAVWWLSRRIRADREQACDDVAVQVCGDGIDLAQALAALACRGLTTPPLFLAAQGGPLMQRVTHILSQPRSHARGAGRPTAFVALLLTSGLLCAMQVAPSPAPHAALAAVQPLPPAPPAPPVQAVQPAPPMPPLPPVQPARPVPQAPPAPPAPPAMAAHPAPPPLPPLLPLPHLRAVSPPLPPIAPTPPRPPAEPDRPRGLPAGTT